MDRIFDGLSRFFSIRVNRPGISGGARSQAEAHGTQPTESLLKNASQPSDRGPARKELRQAPQIKAAQDSRLKAQWHEGDSSKFP